MSLMDQIAEAERMQRWGFAQQLRSQLSNTGVEYVAPNPDNAEPEGADVTPDAPADPEE